MDKSDHLFSRLDKLSLKIDPFDKKLIKNYLLELWKWNKVHNLVGINTANGLVDLLVFDSLLAINHLDLLHRKSRLSSLSILDVGAGNGSPSIVWAIIRKNLEFTLVEKSRKKAAFLKHLTQNLNLSQRVMVCNHRIEKHLPSNNVNIITCRAFMDIERFLELTCRLASRKTYWLLMTSVKLSRQLSKQFLQKKGIIKLSGSEEALNNLDKSYENNFEAKKVLLLEK